MIIIPDIHGRTFWKKALEGREQEKTIFLGDYTDPYPKEDIDCYEGLRALSEVIKFKEQHADNVVLLLGNHDLSYISNYMFKCRHDYDHHDDICALLTSNLHLFDIAYEQRVGERHVLFSHAGILPGWLSENTGILGSIKKGEEVDRINHMFHHDHIYAALGDVSPSRGGHLPYGSCVWADVSEFLDAQPLLFDGCYQVFGHTQLSCPMITDSFACLDCRAAFNLDEQLNFTQIGDG